MQRFITFLVLLAASPIAAADLICIEDISSIEKPWKQAVCQARLDQDVIRTNNLRLFVHLHRAARSDEACPSPGEYLPALLGFQNRVRAADEALCDLNMLIASGSGMAGAGYGPARTACSAYTVGHLLDRLEDTHLGPYSCEVPKFDRTLRIDDIATLPPDPACRDAVAQIDQDVCADPELRLLDAYLASLYAAALELPDRPDNLELQRHNFLKYRESSCEHLTDEAEFRACIRFSYVETIDHLSSLFP